MTFVPGKGLNMKQEISSEQFETYLKQNNVYKLAKFFIDWNTPSNWLLGNRICKQLGHFPIKT